MMAFCENVRQTASRLTLVLCLGALPAVLAACDDPVRSTPAAEVQLSASSPFLAVGDTLRLTAVAKDASGGTLANPRLSWSSNNDAVASVNADGVVRGVSPGKATITATSGTASGRVEVTVEPPVARVTLEPDTTLVMVVGNTVELRTPTADAAENARARVLAVPRDASGGVMLGVGLRYASSNEAVATVSDAGVVRAVAPGTATITARAGHGEGRLIVTVERPYTLTYLGTLEGLAQSRATGVNELGQVVGYSYPAESSGAMPAGARGWIWRNGALTAISLPDTLGLGASPTVLPSAVNDRGQLAGLAQGSGRNVVFRWEGGSSALAVIPGPRATVSDLNERGEVVGFWIADFCTRNCTGGGFVFRGGAIDTLSNYGQLRIAPRAINDEGQITGALFRVGAGTSWERAVLLESADADVTYLPTSDVASHAFDVDNRGRVVGLDFVGGQFHAFSWSRSAGLSHLGTLPSANISVAIRTSEAGPTVGTSNCAGCTAALPVLFRNGKVIRIEDLYVQGNWVFEGVADINERGQIVGHGRHRTTGATGALLLTPPQ